MFPRLGEPGRRAVVGTASARRGEPSPLPNLRCTSEACPLPPLATTAGNRAICECNGSQTWIQCSESPPFMAFSHTLADGIGKADDLPLMEHLAREFMAAIFLVVGLSHAAHPMLWRQLFVDLGRLPYAPFMIAIVTMPIGLFAVLCHNVWALQPALIITVFGWSMTIKSVIYALCPLAYRRVAAIAVDTVSPRRIRCFQVGALAVAGMCGWILFEEWLGK